MGSIGRNYDGHVAEVRDFILSSEKEHLEELLKENENVEKIREYMDMPLKTILRVCKSIISAMEMGVVSNQDGDFRIIDEATSERLEKQLILMMASIDDVQMAKILELTKDENSLAL